MTDFTIPPDGGTTAESPQPNNDNKQEDRAKRLITTAVFNGFIQELRRNIERADGDIELGMAMMDQDLRHLTEVKPIADMNAYLDERAKKAGLIAPCINPHCTNGENGQRATVDRRKKKSGACCKACMNYECTHPDCVTKAAANGWRRYTHAWGTKIAALHAEWRKPRLDAQRGGSEAAK